MRNNNKSLNDIELSILSKNIETERKKIIENLRKGTKVILPHSEWCEIKKRPEITDCGLFDQELVHGGQEIYVDFLNSNTQNITHSQVITFDDTLKTETDIEIIASNVAKLSCHERMDKGNNLISVSTFFCNEKINEISNPEGISDLAKQETIKQKIKEYFVELKLQDNIQDSPSYLERFLAKLPTPVANFTRKYPRLSLLIATSAGIIIGVTAIGGGVAASIRPVLRTLDNGPNNIPDLGDLDNSSIPSTTQFMSTFGEPAETSKILNAITSTSTAHKSTSIAPKSTTKSGFFSTLTKFLTSGSTQTNTPVTEPKTPISTVTTPTGMTVTTTKSATATSIDKISTPTETIISTAGAEIEITTAKTPTTSASTTSTKANTAPTSTSTKVSTTDIVRRPITIESTENSVIVTIGSSTQFTTINGVTTAVVNGVITEVVNGVTTEVVNGITTEFNPTTKGQPITTNYITHTKGYTPDTKESIKSTQILDVTTGEQITTIITKDHPNNLTTTKIAELKSTGQYTEKNFTEDLTTGEIISSNSTLITSGGNTTSMEQVTSEGVTLTVETTSYPSGSTTIANSITEQTGPGKWTAETIKDIFTMDPTTGLPNTDPTFVQKITEEITFNPTDKNWEIKTTKVNLNPTTQSPISKPFTDVNTSEKAPTTIPYQTTEEPKSTKAPTTQEEATQERTSASTGKPNTENQQSSGNPTPEEPTSASTKASTTQKPKTRFPQKPTDQITAQVPDRITAPGRVNINNLREDAGSRLNKGQLTPTNQIDSKVKPPFNQNTVQR